MKIDVAKAHESNVRQAVSAANEAIMSAVKAGCVVECDIVDGTALWYGHAPLISAVVKVHPGDIET